MKKSALLLFALAWTVYSIKAQDSMVVAESAVSKFAGYHFGVVQIIFAANGGEITTLDKTNFYSIGFPFGLTLNTGGKTKIDLEFVPSIKPYIQTETPYEVHFLFHPGVLFPLNKGWTFGMRLAFEVGDGQYGFTPLLNKAFRMGEHADFFVELVAPARFGPEKDSGYTQLGGIHVGIGF